MFLSLSSFFWVLVSSFCSSWMFLSSFCLHTVDLSPGLRPCGSLPQHLLWGWKFLPLPPRPPQEFSVRGFEALLPHTGTLGCSVCLAPQLFLLVYPHVSMGSPGPPVTTLQWVLSAWLPVSTPPTGLDECFFFNSWLSDFHTVRFSVSSGCFLFLNVVVLLLVV